MIERWNLPFTVTSCNAAWFFESCGFRCVHVTHGIAAGGVSKNVYSLELHMKADLILNKGKPESQPRCIPSNHQD